MSQQLQLFANSPQLDDYPDFSTTHLFQEQTRRFFQHQGTDAELIQRILQATKAIHELCKKPGAS